jgi:hypothetical protein
MENRRGEMAGYKVVAPAGAQGYILPANVRPATPEEIRAILGAPAKPEPPKTEITKTNTRPVQPEAAQSGTAPEPEPAPTKTEPKSTPVAQTTAPEATPNAEPTDATEIEMGKPTPAPQPVAGASNAAPRRLEDVDAAYKQVMKQGIQTAEFSQLIAEYSAILASLPSTEDADLERSYIEDRIELLEIRAQVQEDMRNLAALEVQTESAQQNLDEFVRKVQAARGYVVVGTLSPSIIYDGDRMPRMFRVVSVDAASGGRTLAYVLPNPDLNMVGTLGSLVGVQGEDDPTARRGEVRVIKPTAVDVLTTDAGTVRPTSATAVSDGSDSAGS